MYVIFQANRKYDFQVKVEKVEISNFYAITNLTVNEPTVHNHSGPSYSRSANATALPPTSLRKTNRAEFREEKKEEKGATPNKARAKPNRAMRDKRSKNSKETKNKAVHLPRSKHTANMLNTGEYIDNSLTHATKQLDHLTCGDVERSCHNGRGSAEDEKLGDGNIIRYVVSSFSDISNSGVISPSSTPSTHN